MSQWTHVNGSIRVDAILTGREYDIRKALGKIVTYKDLGVYDTTHLPMGSEGSLEYTIWTNSDRTCLAKHTVNIFGDLRDYDDVDEIKNWFADVIKTLGLIRAASLEIEVEYGPHIILVWNGESIVQMEVPKDVIVS